MKKIILLLTIFTPIFIFIEFGYTHFIEASSSIEVCRLKGKIESVTDEYIQIQVSKVSIYDRSSTYCANIEISKEYQIKRDNFLRNAWGKDIFAGQNLIIDGTVWSAMGPNGAVSGESWELESAGNVIIKLPISFEKINFINVQENKIDNSKKDVLIKGKTYTITEITGKVFKKNEKVLAEGYVFFIYKCPPCPRNLQCEICEKPHIIFSEIVNVGEKTSEDLSNQQLYVFINDSDYQKLELRKKYKLELRFDGQITSGRQDFSLVSIERLITENYSVATSTTPIITTEQPFKKSLISRFASWIVSLFRKHSSEN